MEIDAAVTSENFKNQSTLVYAWEQHTFPLVRNIGDLSLNECQTLVSSTWFNLGFSYAAPPVCDGRGSCDARAYLGRIHLPRWARNKLIVLHELAHCVTGLFDEPDSYNHSGKFMQVYLRLLAQNRINKYTSLVQNARDYGLTVSPTPVRRHLMKLNQ